MAEALQRTEGINGVKPFMVANSDVAYCTKVLNKECVDLFAGDTQELDAFVYAIDCLIDISKSGAFPSKRLLNNEDIAAHPLSVNAFNRLARETRDDSLFGCQVSVDTAEYIKEFFAFKYPLVIGRFLARVGFPFATFKFGANNYQLTLIRSLNPVQGFAALKLREAETGMEVCLPFLAKRLTE